MVTHVAQRVDTESADSMRQYAGTKNLEVCNGDAEVPEEVASSKRLDQTTGASVSPNAALPVHGSALLVGPHAVEGDSADQGALEERHDVGVPARPLALVGRVVFGGIFVGQPRRDDEVDEGVEEGRTDDLVDMLGEHGQVVLLGVWSHPLLECGYGCYEERILHCCGCLEG